MIGTKKSEHVFLWPLVSLIYPDSICHKLKGIKHKSNTIQKFSLSCSFEHVSIKGLFIRFRNHIPDLSRPSMTIINRIKPKILNMPAKSRKLHTHVDPRNSNSADFFIVDLSHFKNRRLRFVDVIQVKTRSSIVKILVLSFKTFMHWKPRTILMSWQVSCVLNSHLVLL